MLVETTQLINLPPPRLTRFTGALSGTMLAMHLATLSGTIFVYQGQELGQINVGADWDISEFKDVGSINLYDKHLTKRRTAQGKDDVDMADVMLALKNKSRDNARVPVMWSQDEHGGHSAKPWMRMHSDHKEWNAASQSEDPKSVLNFYRKMFKVRKENDVLVSAPSRNGSARLASVHLTSDCLTRLFSTTIISS